MIQRKVIVYTIYQSFKETLTYCFFIPIHLVKKSPVTVRQETDIDKIQLVRFPGRPVSLNSEIEFVLQKNGTSGCIEVNLESESGFIREIPLRILDFDRYAIRFAVTEVGDHFVHIKYNSEPIPNSPFRLRVHDYDGPATKSEVFSYASLVKPIGMGLKRINLRGSNEFRIDAMNAGDDKLLVGIYGPYGYIDELFIHHLGAHLYYVKYHAAESGPYIISILWGGENVPGSPYFIEAKN